MSDGHLRHSVVVDIGNEVANSDDQRVVVTAACEDLERALAVIDLPDSLWSNQHLCNTVEAIRQVVLDGSKPTLFSVSAKLRTMGCSNSLSHVQSGSSSLAYLDELSFRDAIKNVAGFHARRVRSVALLGLAQKLGRVENIGDFDDQVLETFAKFDRGDAPLTGGTDPEIVEREIRLIETGQDGEGIYPTGFSGLDKLIGGFGRGKVSLLLGHTSSGKTTFGAQSAGNVAQHGVKVYFEELEMNLRELARRRISSHVGKPIEQLSSEELAHALAMAGRCHLLHWECASGKLDELQKRVAHRMRAHPDTGLFCLDYLGLVQPFSSNSDPVREASAVSDALKGIAQRYQVAVVAMQQPNRNRDGRADKRPVLSDIRDSSKLAQDAHHVLFLHRPWEHDKSQPHDLVELHVLKNRSGPLGVVELTWNPATYQFKTRTTNRRLAPSPEATELPEQAHLEDLF